MRTHQLVPVPTPSGRGEAGGVDAEQWWRRLALVASVSPKGVFAAGTAARIHGLACCDDYEAIDVVCPKGWSPRYDADVRLRHTRGLTPDDIAVVVTPGGELQVLTLATTLVLMGAVCDERSVDRAVVDAMSLGLEAAHLRDVARRWSQRGRVGPPTLLRVLDDRLGRRLPERWFIRLSVSLRQCVDAQVGAVVRHHRVGNSLGSRGIDVPVAVPQARVAVVERPTPAVQRQLHDRGWSVVNVGWRDIDRLDRVVARVAMAVAYAPRLAA